jgi:hypothetical protein
MVHYGGNGSWACILMTSEKRYESVSLRVHEPEKNHLIFFSKYRFILEAVEVGCAF